MDATQTAAAADGTPRHTPTPWEFDVDGEFAGNLSVTGPGGESILGATLGCDTDEENLGNVDFMRRAVNGRDALLAACRNALVEAEALHQVLRLDPRNRGIREGAYVQELRDAIAKAEGKG
jgi:hypothetical protein